MKYWTTLPTTTVGQYKVTPAAPPAWSFPTRGPLHSHFREGGVGSVVGTYGRDVSKIQLWRLRSPPPPPPPISATPSSCRQESRRVTQIQGLLYGGRCATESTPYSFESGSTQTCSTALSLLFKLVLVHPCSRHYTGLLHKFPAHNFF